MADEPPSTVGFGNVVFNRVVAIGNVVHGIVAIGNVAVGVVAIGNVAAGVIAIGGTNAFGIVSFSFINCVPCLVGYGLLLRMPTVPWGPMVALVPLVASFLLAGERSARRTRTTTARLMAEGGSGWVELFLAGATDDRLRLQADGQELEIEASPEVIASAQTMTGRPVDVSMRRITQSTDDAGYRLAGATEHSLKAEALAAIEPNKMSQREVAWWIARCWRYSAIVAIVVGVARMLLE